ncbi:MAG: PQQ-binding-like beta-propeller repeat protein [Planctomycetales bacterium]|nr:PQQ-binding-like beta-propeller repeat protein [Planctomycetales bacterium]
MLKQIIWLLAVVLVVQCSQAADEWPQFRGPGGQGHAVATGLPVTWSESEHVTWKTAIPGAGWSSPVISGDQIWFTTATDVEGTPPGKSLRAVCVDRSSGMIRHDIEVFRLVSPPLLNAKNTFASPTPVLEAGRLYVHFGTYGTACLDTTSGEVLWKNEELKLDHKEGPGSSPVLHGDKLILTCDGTDVQFVAALDKATGKVVWNTKRTGKLNFVPDFRKAYCTPLVITTDGKTQVIVPGADQVIAYDPASGDEIWKARYVGFSNVPRPVFGHDLVFVCTGYMKPELWAIRPNGSGTVEESHITWKTKKQIPTNPSPLLVGDSLFIANDRGIFTCFDAKSGEELWTERVGGNFSSSPLFADGRIYISSEEGLTHVLKPGRKFESLAKNQLDGRILASPAVVDHAIYLRTDKSLYRIEP